MRPAHSLFTAILRQHCGDTTLIPLHFSPVGGGSINMAWKIEPGAGVFFGKENDAALYPGMFEAEEKGLLLLEKANAFRIPRVAGCRTDSDFSVLVLEWLEKDVPGEQGWYTAGKLLAKQHRIHAERFGLDHSNYIGSLPQSNRQHDTWENFFAEERILPQIRLARDAGKINTSLSAKAERFCKKITELFPPEKPSLLHGDLWSGNFFFSTEGPAVFDPAVYFGHREMDLGMTKLFGGFNEDFYAGYENDFPLTKGWHERTDFCNLYPLLVHVNLFGGGYTGEVEMILRRF